jgi:hypothetical protein
MYVKNNIYVNDYTDSPKIAGNLEISKSQDGVFIGGDPPGLRSLAAILVWLADIDQESPLNSYPDGWFSHIHLHARDIEGFNSLTVFSEEVILSRLDAKGTGEFPERYRNLPKR